MTVSVLIPTTAGRRYLDEAVAAYKRQADQVVVVRDRDCCGTAWNDGLPSLTGDYIHLGADDFLPADGAIAAGIEALERGWFPAPRVTGPDGELDSCGSLGGGMRMPECPDGTICNMSNVVTFRRGDGMEDWIRRANGLHYYADDLLSYGAQVVGYKIRVVRAYEFQHRVDTVNRARIVDRSARDYDLFVHRAVEGYVDHARVSPW